MPDPTITVRGRSDFSQMNRGLDQASGKVSSFASKARRAAVVGLAVAGAAAVKFGIDSVKAASDQEESINAVRVSYGKAAEGILKLGRNSATSFALSRTELNSTAVQFSGFVSTIAGKGGDVVNTFRSITGRATDFASVMNLDVSKALELFQSGLAGETEPLRRYGIDLSAAAVQAFAYAKGIANAGDELTEQQKVQARYQLLLKQTAKTQGDFANTSDSLANRQRILSARFEDVQAKIGKLLLPVASKLFELLADKGIPALDDMVGWLERNQDEIEETARSVGDALLPHLETLADVAGAVAGFLADLPGPVKEFGVQAGAAAFLVAKLNGAIATSGQTGLLHYANGLRDAETRTAALARAARTAAGVGGILALTQGMQKAETQTGKLLTILGGAATGFAVGGPLGLAVGGVAGVLLTLRTELSRTNERMELGQDAAKGYAATLDKVSGAAKTATRETAALGLQQAGAFELAGKLGIRTRDLVSATLGNEDALRRVNAQMALTGESQEEVFERLRRTGDQFTEAGKAEYAMVAASEELRKILGFQSGELEKNVSKTRELSIASGTLAKSLKGVKDRSRIVSRIEMLGWPEAPGQVNKLIRGLNLTPKEKRIVFKALGIKDVERDARRVGDRIKDVGKQPVSAETFTQSIKRMMSTGNREVDGGGRNIKKGLKDAGKTDLDKRWLNDLTSSLTTGKQRASSGGRGVGAALKSGVLGGLSGLTEALSNDVAAAVNAAIAAGRRAADANSPSRKMYALGKDMADGLAYGVARGQGKNEKAGQTLVQKILDGISRARIDDVREALGKINDLIEKTYGKRFKNEKRAREETKKALKAMRDEERAIRRNGQLREKIAKKLERAEQKLKDLQRQRADYARAVKDAALDFASITNLDTAFNADALAAGLQKRLEKLRQFASIIADLTSRGLNATTLQQLIDAGVEGGLAEALALQQGGDAAIDQINSIQEQINQVAGQLGDSTASTMYDAGIQAAEGLVQGLRARKKDLQKIARELAKDLIKALKKELGIKSPSAVFRDLGRDTARGLTIGLEDVHVKRAGSRLAGELIDGFGRPELTAAAVTNGIGAQAAAAGQGFTVNVKLTAEQASLVQQGKQVTIAIDAYKAAGGKATTG